MYRLLFLLVLVTATGGVTLPVTNAYAQATRTWVSGVGDDANPCSRTAPCKTFAGAISKTAAGGEIDCLDPGGFGTVTITKPITIDCVGTLGSILASATNGVIISLAQTAFPNGVVTLRNLSINGAGTTPGIDGIRFIQGGAALHVENCKIFGFSGQGIEFIPTASANLFVRDTQISEAAGGGILIQPGAGANVKASLDNVNLDFNAAFGLEVHDRAAAAVSRSRASKNGNGFRSVSTAAAADILIRESVADGNSIGLSSSGGSASVRMTDVLIVNNGTGISGNVFTWGNNYNTNNSTAGAPNNTLPLQ